MLKSVYVASELQLHCAFDAATLTALVVRLRPTHRVRVLLRTTLDGKDDLFWPVLRSM